MEYDAFIYWMQSSYEGERFINCHNNNNYIKSTLITI